MQVVSQAIETPGVVVGLSVATEGEEDKVRHWLEGAHEQEGEALHAVLEEGSRTT